TCRLVSKLKHDEAVIGGIGNTNFDLWAAGPRPQNFYMLGSMGLACPIALGVALAQPQRRVFALEGDGSLLMQLGCLTTIATLAPPNYRPHSHLGQDGEHALAFVLVGLAFGLAYRSQRLLATAIAVILIGGLEVAQFWAPGRHARLEDFAVDAAAACIGFGL